jgi:hypothetical protein
MKGFSRNACDPQFGRNDVTAVLSGHKDQDLF